MNWSFFAGMLTGINLAGIVYWQAAARMRRVDAEFQAETSKRIDALSEWSTRQYDKARREVGLPPRPVT